MKGNGAGWCAAVGDLSLSGGRASGYNAEETMYVVYPVAWVVVVRRCVGSEGEGGR